MKYLVNVILGLLFAFCVFMAGYEIADNKVHVTSHPMYISFDQVPLMTIDTTFNPIQYGIDDNGTAWFNYSDNSQNIFD